VVTGGTGCQHTVVTVVADEELQVDLVTLPKQWYYLTTAVPEHLLCRHTGDSYNHYHNKLSQVVRGDKTEL